MPNIFNQKIIDTHHHFWDPTSNKYDWLIAPEFEVLNNIYLLKDYIFDLDDLNIIKSVHIQAEINLSETLFETKWLQNIGKFNASYNKNCFPNAIIGFANFLNSNVEKTLLQHIESSNFRGIRQILKFDKNNKKISHPVIDYLKEDIWLKNFSLLRKYNLLFELLILYNQAEDAAKLISKESNTLFIINHTLAPINVNKENIEKWLAGIKLLSSFENVAIKLSGFGEFNSKWTEDTIRPLILNSIDNFGIDRCMFGTNFPVDKYLSSASYFDYWNAYYNIVNDFNENEKDKLFYINAENFYRI